MNPARDYLSSIHYFLQQFDLAWDDVEKILFQVPQVHDVIISGMGGSSFGGRVVEAVYSDHLNVPVDVIEEYTLPDYADEKTLIVATSYSGNTEEVLNTVIEARGRGCTIFGITSGGKLGEAIKSHRIAGYIFDAKYNPAATPRTAIGYLVGATLSLLSQTQLINIPRPDFSTISCDEELLKGIAKKMVSTIPVFVAAEHLAASSLIWRNFMNETAKQLGFELRIPALNHHFLDGLQLPETANKQLTFIYLNSQLYHRQNQKRMKATREITKKQGYKDISLNAQSKTKIDQFWEILQQGCLISYYLSQIHAQNPATNEMVDYLKERL